MMTARIPFPNRGHNRPDRQNCWPWPLDCRLLPLLVAALLAAQSLSADELRVAVASNFRHAMDGLAERFETETGHEITVIVGSSGKHYAQIVNGAPFDAFFSADVDRPLRLEREQRIVPGTRFTFAMGKLVLWSPREGFVDPAGRILLTGAFDHLAIANPRLAPYGAAAREVLESLGLWGQLGGKLVRGENIGQTFQFVASGNADLGFVSRAQLETPGRAFGGSGWEPPRTLYSPIEQQAVLLRETAPGRAFLTFVQTEEARALIRAYGYDVTDVQ
jgi:molybdate transport system substrate-binding protein